MWVEQGSVIYARHHHQQPYIPSSPTAVSFSKTTTTCTNLISNTISLLLRSCPNPGSRRRDAAWERSSPTNLLFKSAIPGKRRLRQGKRESTWKGIFKKCASFITNATVSLADHHQILMVHLLYPLTAHSWTRMEKLC